MSEQYEAPAGNRQSDTVPPGLLLFCFALMGPACGINAAFIALAVPAMAPFGINGLVVAGGVGSLLGVLPALWLARRIHEGLRDR
jgi:hypothetical protein